MTQHTYAAALAENLQDRIKRRDATIDELKTVVLSVKADHADEIERLHFALSSVANHRNEFEGPSLDYMQGYRDGQEVLQKMARKAIP